MYQERRQQKKTGVNLHPREGHTREKGERVIRLVNEVGTKAVRAWESREREGKEILQASTEYQKREPLFRNVFLRHRRRVHHTTSAQSSKRLLTIAQPAATQRTTTTTVCIPVVSDRLCIFCARCKHNTTRAPGVWKHSQDPDRVISKEPTSWNPAQYKNTKK